MAVNYCKNLPIKGEYDVLVCGGGPAGFTAAVQAGRLGLKVALVERSAALGGVITTGGNNEIALFYAHGMQIIAGVGWELVTRLAKVGMARIPDFSPQVPYYLQGVIVNLPMVAQMMDQMCAEANVDLFLMQQVVDAIVSDVKGMKTVDGVVTASKEGLGYLRAKRIIDCTGDGDVCALAGAAYELADEETKELQPGTLRFFPSGYKLEDIDEAQVKQAFEKGVEDGELLREDYWSGSPYTIFSNRGNNINHVVIDNTSDESRTQAIIKGRESLQRITMWARKNVSGAENFVMDTCGCELGVRESRRITGESYITVKDYLAGKVYDDAVCYSYYPIDLHKMGDKTLENIFFEEGTVPTIPLGALIPKGFSNIMMAGRCASGDRLSNSAYRIKASCMAMGQAAAVASAVSLQENASNKNVSIHEVRRILKDNGAIVPGL